MREHFCLLLVLLARSETKFNVMRRKTQNNISSYLIPSSRTDGDGIRLNAMSTDNKVKNRRRSLFKTVYLAVFSPSR